MVDNNISELFSAVMKRATTLRELSRQSRVGFCPTNRSAVTQHLLDAEDSLRRYDSEIVALRVLLTSLEKERQDVADTVATYKSLLAPINRLPVEILKEIMIFAGHRTTIRINSPSDFKLSSVPTSSLPTSSAMVFSEVSTRWRDVALSSPGLWSDIRLLVYETNEQHDDWDGSSVLRTLQMILERSSSCPLDLEFNVGTRIAVPGFCYGDSMNAILGTLAAESKRWRSVIVHANSSFLCHPALSRIENDLPILREIQFHTIYLGGVEPSPFGYFRSCPSLEVLVTRKLPRFLWRSFPSTSIPWDNIREFSTSEIHVPIQDILRAFRSLRRLSVLIRTAHIMAGDPVESPLESLAIHFPTTNPTVACQCFEGVRFPQLRNLTITNYGHIRPEVMWDESHLLACLQRSSANLTSFTINDVPIRDEQMLRLLQHMPALHTLHIGQCDLLWLVLDHPRPLAPAIITPHMSASLSSLASTPTSPLLLPRLENLSLVVNGENFDTEAFSEVIISRWIPDSARAQRLGVACLKSVEIEFLGDFKEGDEIPVSEDFLAFTECYRDAGLELSLGLA